MAHSLNTLSRKSGQIIAQKERNKKITNDKASEDSCCVFMTSRTAPKLSVSIRAGDGNSSTSKHLKYGSHAWFFRRIYIDIISVINVMEIFTHFHIDTLADVMYGVT